MFVFAGTARADADRMQAALTAFDGIDGLYDLKPTSDGGYIATGFKADNPLNQKGILLKLNAKGEKAWSKNVGGDYVQSVVQTSDGGYAFAGRELDQQGVLMHFYYGKTDKNGEVEWTNAAFDDPDLNSSAAGIAEIPGSGYMLAGFAAGFGKDMDQAVMRTDLNGNEVWAKTIAKSGAQYAYGLMKAAGTGHYILVGRSNGVGNLVNMDVNGNIAWDREYPEPGASLLLNGAVTPDGGYVATGNTTGGTADSFKTILLKTDAQGNMKWVQAYNQAVSSQGSSVVPAKGGGYAITGTTIDYKKMILLKADEAGELQWLHTEEGPFGGRTVLQLTDGSYLVAGAERGSRLWNVYVGPPAGLTADDDLNVINGLDGTMEYSTDNGQSYQTCDPSAPPAFAGNVSVLVRYKADPSLGYEAGAAAKFIFTASSPAIKEIENLPGKSVSVGAKFEDVTLPETVEATLTDGSKWQVGVVWDHGTPEFDGNRLGDYVFTGTLKLPQGVSNPAGKQAMIKVTVTPLVAVSVEPLPPIMATIGTPISGLGLPNTVTVTLSNQRQTTAEVNWDQGAPPYMPGKIGFFHFTGDLLLPEAILNLPMLKAQADVMVMPMFGSVSEAEPLPDIHVAAGTDMKDLNLPGKIKVTLNNGTTTEAGVSWNLGEPEYNPNQAGVYKFTGELILAGIMNPDHVVAEVKVIVDSVPLRAIADIKQVPDLKVTVGTELSQLELPEQVAAILNDGTEMEVNVTWSPGTPAYDKDQAGIYPFTGELTLPEGVTNPDDQQAKLNVVVEARQQPAEPTLTGITLDSGSYRLEVGKTHATVVAAVYSDDSTKPVTEPLTFRSSQPETAAVDERGIVKGITTGTAKISVEYKGFTAAADVTVWQEPRQPEQPQEPQQPPSGGSSSPSEPASSSQDAASVLPPANPDHSVTGCSSAQPCTAVLSNKVQITIPAEAAASSYTVTIDKITPPAEGLPDQTKMISPVYELKKSFKDKFLLPVTLRFAFNAADIGKGQHPALFYLDEASGQWVEIKSKAENGRIMAEADQLAKFAVFAVPEPKEEQKKQEEQEQQPVHSYQDIKGHWAENLIREAVAQGLATGYDGDLFKPDQTVTRAEFTVMLMRALKTEKHAADAKLSFKDAGSVPSWAKESIAAAASQKLIDGYDDGTFRPEGQITRAEMTAMIVRALHLPVDVSAALSFTDKQDIPVWAKGPAAAAVKQGIIKGLNGQFAPARHATRAEAAAMLLRMRQPEGL